METSLPKAFLICIFALYLCVHRTTTAPPDNSDTSQNPFQKFTHFGILSSSGLTLKSKNNIFGHKFPSKKPTSLNVLNLLLILSGLEVNPGPHNPKRKQTKFPCGICHKQCTWRQPSVACDVCDIWYHKKCLQMNSAVFDNLQNVSWICCKCGLPNFSSGLFSKSHSDVNCSNSFETLNSTILDEPIPIFTSTPKSTKSSKSKSSKPFMGLNLMLINFQSLFNKRVEFSNLLAETKCDVVIGTETWLSPEHKNSELLLDNYDIFRKDRASRGGGVLIATRKDLCAVEVPSSTDTESVFCKLNIKGKKSIVFGSVYRPPNSDLNYSLKLNNEIYSIYNKHKNATLWLGGDFNLPDIDWLNHEIKGNQNPQNLNSLYLDMSSDLCLDQIIDFPTRDTAILDLIFTNRPDIAKFPKLLAGLGDHEAVTHKISLQPFRKKPTKREILLWNKADKNKLVDDAKTLRSKFLDLFDVKSSVVDMWSFLKKEIDSIIKENVPSKITSSKQHQPWINTKKKKDY